MKKILLYSLAIFPLIFSSYCYAQTEVNLSKPRLELKGNSVDIFYDILNTKQADKFKIWIEISDSTGKKINAKTLSGDIGRNINGGNNKKITWNLDADNIILDAIIYFQINAEVLKIAEPVKPVDKPIDKPIQTAKIDKPSTDISRGGVILKSVIFPGWGLSKINKGKPHWIKGVLGYGCFTAAYIYNKKATSSYDDYLNTPNLRDSETFFDDAVKADNMSEAFAYTAVGIWVVDIIWTIAGSSKLKKNKSFTQLENFSLKTAYEPNMNASLISLSYNF